MGEKNISLRIPDHVWEQIKDLGKREGRSFNSEVVYSIVHYLKEEGYNIDMKEFKGMLDSAEEKPNSEENAG